MFSKHLPFSNSITTPNTSFVIIYHADYYVLLFVSRSRFLKCFRDPVWVPKIREIGSLQVHARYLTFSVKILFL